LVDGPCPKRPNFSQPFYLKTDWSKIGMGAAICQADVADEDKVAIKNKGAEEPSCVFDLTRSGMRLRPCAMISRRNSQAE
jgi:hypothetical protein